MNSVYRFFGWGTISIGTLLGGLMVSGAEPWLGREWALRVPFLVAAAVYLLLMIYAARQFTAARLASAATEVAVSADD